MHLKNIFKEKELDESATTEEFSVVQQEGSRDVTRKVFCYSLEAIIVVGYRANSECGTQFRQWATAILKQYIHKGFAVDSDGAFLKFSDYEILTNAGTISHEVAVALANKEYAVFKKIQDNEYISDFDKVIKRISGKPNANG